MPTIPPLITSAQVLAALNLSAADQARVPGAIVSASRMVRRYCDRFLSERPSTEFGLGPIDELITPPRSGRILLKEYPVNDILRCSSSKTPILTVSNTDAITNQRAICKLTRTGEEIIGFTTTGIYLERWASGENINTTILFTSLSSQTIGALAAAITAQGGGWLGASGGDDAGNGDDYSLWPVSELRAGQGAQGALQDQAEFAGWTEDVEIERDDESGIITLVRSDDNPFTSPRWGPTAGLEFGDEDIRGGLHAIRVVYDAGYATIPEDLQDACVEVVQAMLQRKAIDLTVAAERTDSWNIVRKEVIHAISPSAREVLGMYRDHAR